MITKLLTITVLFLLPFNDLFAQQKETNVQTNIGFKAGLSYSGYHGSDYEDMFEQPGVSVENRLSWMGGVAFNTMVAKHFWLKHEFYVANKGFKATYDDGSSLERERMYVDFYPFVFAFHIKGFQLFAAPYGGGQFLVNDTYTSDTGEKSTDDQVDDEQFFDFGGMAGIEYEIPHVGINFGIRYHRGYASDLANSQVNIHNQALYFTIGYSFVERKY